MKIISNNKLTHDLILLYEKVNDRKIGIFEDIFGDGGWIRFMGEVQIKYGIKLKVFEMGTCNVNELKQIINDKCNNTNIQRT